MTADGTDRVHVAALYGHWCSVADIGKQWQRMAGIGSQWLQFAADGLHPRPIAGSASYW